MGIRVMTNLGFTLFEEHLWLVLYHPLQVACQSRSANLGLFVSRLKATVRLLYGSTRNIPSFFIYLFIFLCRLSGPHSLITVFILL